MNTNNWKSVYFLFNAITFYFAILNFPLCLSSKEYNNSDSQTAENSPSLHGEEVQIRSGIGGDYCNCTSLFQCDIGGSSTENGESMMDDDENGADLEVINIRNGLPSTQASGFSCSHYLEICCNQYQRNSQLKQSSSPSLNRPVSLPKDKRLQCGKRNVNGVGFRIVGGIEGEAQMGEFTWMIAVTELNKEKEGTVYLCGGSLIHPRVVLTAAHCVENKLVENVRIRAGEWDTNTDREDPYVHYDRNVDKIIIHEDYAKRGVLKNDIALLILSKEVPMCLAIGTSLERIRSAISFFKTPLFA